MNKKAFTLVEVLLAMTVVGIIAAVTANSLGNITANKTKAAFQNNYKHMVEVINAIMTDETIYPVISTGTYNWTGTSDRISICNYNKNLFPQEFVNHTKVISQSNITNGYSFETQTGALWVVKRNPEQSTCSNNGERDYVIIFDVNGLAEGTNCPYKGSDLSTVSSGTCNNPDTFKFLLGAGNRIVIADGDNRYGSSNLYQYMSDNHYLNFDY